VATLEQFLRTGELGPIHPGMTADEVAAVLGPTPDISMAKHPLILRYGGLQLSFIRGDKSSPRRLTLIGLYFWPNPLPLPPAATPTDWLPTESTTEADVLAYLHRIRLSPDEQVGTDFNRYLLVPSGARMVIGEDERLHSIQYADRGSVRKQLSITIPEPTFYAVKDAARKANRTVGDLCSEWIAEKVHTPE